MKFTPMRRIVNIFCVICMIMSLSVSAAAADESIYINSSEHMIQGENSELYAIGGNSQIAGLTAGEQYALSGAGVQKVGSSYEETVTPSVSPTVTPEPTPTPNTGFTYPVILPD